MRTMMVRPARTTPRVAAAVGIAAVGEEISTALTSPLKKKPRPSY
jgi:hypothetical protein